MKTTIVNPVFKDTATFVHTSAETGGKLTEMLMTLQPGGGNTLHYHKTYAETFTPINGQLGVQTGKKVKQYSKPAKLTPFSECSFTAFLIPEIPRSASK